MWSTLAEENIAKWNASKANCYAYAFELEEFDRTLDPGELSGIPPPVNVQQGCADLVRRVLSDSSHICTKHGCRVEYLGEHILLQDYSHPDQTLIYMAVDQRRPDYHFYKRLGAGLRWTHKPGQRGVRVTDGSGAMIVDPRTANHDYVDHDYSLGCGFFLVTKL